MLKKIFGLKTDSSKDFLKELYEKNINTQKLTTLLESNSFSINHQDENGDGFLHLCIANNKFQSAKWLIEKTDIDLSLKNKNDKNPLLLAVEKNNYLIVDLILKTNKVDINQKDSCDRSLLQNAVLSGSKETAMRLIRNKIDINMTDNNKRNVLFDAIAYGDDELTLQMVEIDGIDLNAVDIKGETILHKPETIKNEALAEKLLQRGADPTICDDEGKNFLYHCAMQGIEGSRLLDLALKHGCNINARVKNNSTVLIETFKAFYMIPEEESKRRESMFEMGRNLIIKGIDINAVNDEGESGIFDAIRNNDYDVCAFFINQGSEINIKNKNHETPLWIAVFKGIENIDIILLLLRNGADPSIKNGKNQSLLEILNELILHTRGFKELQDQSLVEIANPEKQYMMVLKEIFLNATTKIDILDSHGQPLFFVPLLDGDSGLFKLYLANKFNINQLDSNGLNIFYVYIYTVFSTNEYFEEFRGILITMINLGVDINIKDADGKHIFSKVLRPGIDQKLYLEMLEISRFDYESKDRQGRTILHHCVLTKNLFLVKAIYVKNEKVINITDNYGILPLFYAALTLQSDMVKLILGFNNVYITSSIPIPLVIREKFCGAVLGIDRLKDSIKDKDLLRKIQILIDQIKHDFKVEK